MDLKDPITEPREVPEKGLPPKLADLRFKLGLKAKQEPKFRFYALYGHLLRMDVLETALALVLSGKGRNTPGVDGVTADQVVNAEGGTVAFLTQLREELRAKSYRPQPVKRVYIPKANGKMRPLGIPTIRDRVVQRAVVLILEPIFEADFLDCSHGFRPERSAHDAIEQVQENLRAGFVEVYDADLKGYFDSIPHDKLMLGLEQRITDGSMLKLIRLFLRAPIRDGREPPKRPTSGTPQGGVISPLLANSFLHWFDRAFHGDGGPARWAKARMVRYADDFVVMARFVDGRIVGFIEKTIEGRLGLMINREKTRILKVKDEGVVLDFLGYSYRWSRSQRVGGGPRYWRLEASKKAQMSIRDKLRDLTGSQQCFVPIPKLIQQVNRVLCGWLNYYQLGHPAKARWNLVRFAEDRLIGHLRRRSQRPYKPPKGVSFYQHVHDLGLIHAGIKRDG